MAARIKRISWPVRLLILVAALLPLLTFMYPLWHYLFDAPQYPEGLEMEIWSFKLGGRVDLINGLNHYVGFMELNPEEFWELRVLPILISLVTLGGLAAVITGRVRVFQGWLIFYGAFAIAGFTDFFLWLWRFGHSVDPRAAIQIDGYTPPMLGTSQFMNFYITAIPGWGAAALAGGFALAIIAYIVHVLSVRRGRVRATAPTAVAAALLLSLVLAGCSSPKPATVVIGQDMCEHCQMLITDARFVTQVVTTKGKAYKFDSIECMVDFLAEGSLADSDIHSAWVSDYNRPGTWIKAEEARYLQSVNIRSPMGANLAAFSTLQELEDAKVAANGLERRYEDLPGVLRDSGFSGGHAHEHLFENLQGGQQAEDDGHGAHDGHDGHNEHDTRGGAGH